MLDFICCVSPVILVLLVHWRHDMGERHLWYMGRRPVRHYYPGLCALLGYIDPDGSLTNLLLTLSPELVLIFHLDFTTLREDTWVSMLLLGHCMGWFCQ